MDNAAAAGPSSPGGTGARKRRTKGPRRRLRREVRPRWGSFCALPPPAPGEGPRGEYRRALRRVSVALVRAQKEIRVLRSLHWPDSVAHQFFARGERELPRVEYSPLGYDPERKVAELRVLEEQLDARDPLQVILREMAAQYAQVVRMLRARGTAGLHSISRDLYGHPMEPFAGQTTTSLDLARHLDRLLGNGGHHFPGEHVNRRFLSAEAASRLLQRRIARSFPGARVRVEVSSMLTADAAAGSSKIRIKRGRMFGRDTLDYLVQHEGLVHIATTLNGRLQPYLNVLGKASPRGVRVNEGLAVFGEWASHTMTLPRVRRLVDRVLAIRMAEEGADFLQVYRAFRERGEERQSAFDIARRVFRGGVLEGGAPFTKDSSYLSDFLRIFNFARVAAKRRRMDLLDLLFVGKVTIPDLPVLSQHLRTGEIRPGRYLPPWVRNKDWLTAHMAISSFLNVLHLQNTEAFYDDLFSRCAEPEAGGEGPGDGRREKRSTHYP